MFFTLIGKKWACLLKQLTMVYIPLFLYIELGNLKTESMDIVCQGESSIDNGWNNPKGLPLSYLAFWHTMHLDTYSSMSCCIWVQEEKNSIACIVGCIPLCSCDLLITFSRIYLVTHSQLPPPILTLRACACEWEKPFLSRIRRYLGMKMVSLKKGMSSTQL